MLLRGRYSRRLFRSIGGIALYSAAIRISVEGGSESYGCTTVLRDASAHLEDTHALSIVGPSGGGKTTLLPILAGLETPDGGTVTMSGYRLEYREDRVPYYRRRVGMVVQFYNLFRHLTALDNITCR